MTKTIQTDVAIIGSGIGACILAHQLHKKTLLKIDIFESSPHVGGSLQPIQTPFGAMNFGPKWIPHKPEVLGPLKNLEVLLDRKILGEIDSETLRTFEKGELVTFVGFGDKKPEAIEEWDYYLTPERVEATLPIYSWCQELLKDVPVHIHTKCELTRLETSDSQVLLAMVNGDTIIEAKAFILCTDPEETLKLLPQNQVDPKIRQKISKTKMWTSLSLNLVHRGEVFNSEEPVVLVGPGEVPSVSIGRFLLPRQETGKLVQFSQWLTLILTEATDDEEVYAHALRDLKKQLQKNFPKLLDTVEFEKIVVTPKSHGRALIKFEKDESLQGFNNLWMLHNATGEIPGIAGSVLRAQKIGDALIKRFETHLRDLPSEDFGPSLLGL